jgi:antitoxin component YwqK of YwqJK toxin-antitoxin module
MLEYKNGLPDGIFEIYYPFERNSSNGEDDGYGLYPLTDVFPNLSAHSNRIIDYVGHSSVIAGRPVQFYSVLKRGNFQKGILQGKVEVFEPLHGNMVARGFYNNGLLENSDAYFRNLTGDSLLVHEKFAVVKGDSTISKKKLWVMEPEPGKPAGIILEKLSSCEPYILEERYHNTNRISDYELCHYLSRIEYTAPENAPWDVYRKIMENIMWNKTDALSFPEIVPHSTHIYVDMAIRDNQVHVMFFDGDKNLLLETQYSLQECLGLP